MRTRPPRPIHTLQKAINKAMSEQYPNAGSDPEESLLWQIKHCSNLPAPEREVELIAGKGWRYDFYWPRPKDCQEIIVEVHGGTRSQGRHVRGDGFEEDRRKMNAAARLGYMVIEFTSGQVRNGEALEFLKTLF